ncbi:MAG: class I SAM-dependent methyltransferase [Bacteroidia bacterium]|nr:class I SAM-dependent methyltransferase [Bacteroidia bacterium]
MSNFNLYSQYYDLLYKTKDYKAEADYVANTLKSINKNISSVIELGSGTGNHAQYLCLRDFTVYGIERSGEMVSIANEKNINNYNPTVGDITSFQLEQKVDAAISLFHVISYLTSNEDLIKCFSLTNQHLNEGGVFLFDVWYTPAIYMQQPETRIKRLANEQLAITRLAEPVIHYNENVVDVNYEVIIKDKASHQITTLNETHPMRHFSVNEIKLLAQLTGFEFVRAEEFLTANQPSENTWGVCFILRKK